MLMLYRLSISAVAVAATLSATVAIARAFDESRYPGWEGQWTRTGDGRWDPSKPRALGQEAPLTSEYQKIYEDNLADQKQGGQGTDPTYVCIPDGVPRVMTAVMPLEIVITPNITYIVVEYFNALRRVYTDGRAWPIDTEPSFLGYSIGKWIDESGKGRYDALEIETRSLKGPRVYDQTGIPLHVDNQTVVHERIYLDKTNPNMLHDRVTTIDHALTRPWTVDKAYQRNRNPVWIEFVCAEHNDHIHFGNADYFLSGDGLLMPTKKGQLPPDLRYFEPTKK
jgi:hypothetical protein